MKHALVPVVAAGFLSLAVTVAFAGPPPASASPPHPRNLEQAVKQVQHQTHGHILAADSVARGRTKVYRIKVLTPQGRVKVMQLHSKQQPKSNSGKHDSDQGGH